MRSVKDSETAYAGIEGTSAGTRAACNVAPRTLSKDCCEIKRIPAPNM